MEELMFCNKCGNRSFSSPGNICYKCMMGEYVGTGISYSEAVDIVTRKFYKNHHGKISQEQLEELLKEEYFYGKLDKKLSKKAIQKRIHFDSPEGAKEREESIKRMKNNVPPIAKCPRCGSTSIGTTSRGYSLFSGFIGSGSPRNVCQVCGHKWRPGRE